MVVVGVGNDHEVEFTRVKGEPTVRAVVFESVGVKEPAIEQDPAAFDFEKVSAPGDLAGSPMKRNAQPIILQQNDRPTGQRP